MRGSIFRFFSINWFTYGFPVCIHTLGFVSWCMFELKTLVGWWIKWLMQVVEVLYRRNQTWMNLIQKGLTCISNSIQTWLMVFYILNVWQVSLFSLWQVSLFALSYWSFSFASICAFALLAYVGYVLYAFPSLIWLHRLNGLLLVFILLWAISTYIFNVAFAYVNWKLGKVTFIMTFSITASVCELELGLCYSFLLRIWRSGRWLGCGTIRYRASSF